MLLEAAHGQVARRGLCVAHRAGGRRRRALDHGRDDRKPGKSGNLRHNGPAVGQLRGLAHLGPVVLLPPHDGNGELAATEVLRQRRGTSNQCDATDTRKRAGGRLRASYPAEQAHATPPAALLAAREHHRLPLREVIERLRDHKVHTLLCIRRDLRPRNRASAGGPHRPSARAGGHRGPTPHPRARARARAPHRRPGLRGQQLAQLGVEALLRRHRLALVDGLGARESNSAQRTLIWARPESISIARGSGFEPLAHLLGHSVSRLRFLSLWSLFVPFFTVFFYFYVTN